MPDKTLKAETRRYRKHFVKEKKKETLKLLSKFAPKTLIKKALHLLRAPYGKQVSPT